MLQKQAPTKKSRLRYWSAWVTVCILFTAWSLYETGTEPDEIVPEPLEVTEPEPLPVEEVAVVPEPVKAQVYIVKRGDTLASICGEHSIGSAVSIEIQKALKQLGSAYLRPGQKIVFSTSDDTTTFELFDELETRFVISIKEDSVQSFEKVEAARFSTPVVASGEITTSLFDSAKNLGVSLDIIDDFVDLFSNKVNFSRDIQKGDTFSLIYQEKILESGEVVSTGPLLAARLVSKGREFSAVRYVGEDGKARYFDHSGNFLGKSFLRYPVKFSRISSSFSNSRFHPILKTRRPHNGVDFAAPIGTPVRAVADGVVTFAARKGAAGNMVKIKHSSKYQTAYLHLNSYSVKRGRKVSRGDVIGTVGKTGRATGPHLHYSFYVNGKYVDPMKVDLPDFEEISPTNTIRPNYLQAALKSLKRYENLSTELRRNAG